MNAAKSTLLFNLVAGCLLLADFSSAFGRGKLDRRHRIKPGDSYESYSMVLAALLARAPFDASLREANQEHWGEALSPPPPQLPSRAGTILEKLTPTRPRTSSFPVVSSGVKLSFQEFP